MTDYVYDKSGQDIFFVREDSYGLPADPQTSANVTAWTKLPQTYTLWRKLDYITDSFDPVLPIIEKLKIFDIGDSKHASAIASGNIEPVEFSINMEAQGLEFLMFAIGAPAVSSHGQKFKTEITCVADVSGSLNDTYFLIDGVNAAGTQERFCVWFDVDSGGSAPTVEGIADANRLEVDISANDTAATIQAAVATKIAAEAEFADDTSAAAVVKLVAANNGAVLPAHDSGSTTKTGFAFSQTTQGSTTYTVTEVLTTILPSFTLHLEQRNTTAAESIIWDLFGCVIDSVEVNVSFNEKIVKYTVGIKCPYAVAGDLALNPPARKQIDTMASMSALQESAAAYIIQEGTTDRTPTTVEKVTFSINNNINFQPDVAARYMKLAISGKRDVTMNIVGATHEKELFDYWQGAYTLDDDGYYRPTASAEDGKLNTVFKLQREATYDYISITVYNWLLRDHNFTFVSVDDAIKMVDMTFEDGSADSNGRILTSTTFVSYIDGSIMVV